MNYGALISYVLRVALAFLLGFGPVALAGPGGFSGMLTAIGAGIASLATYHIPAPRVMLNGWRAYQKPKNAKQ